MAEPLPVLPLIDAALRGALVALCMVLVVALWRLRRSMRVLRVLPGAATSSPPVPPALLAALGLCLGLIVQAVGSHPSVENQANCLLQTPLIGLAVGNAVLFWLFSAALFDDEFRWRRRHALAWGAAALIGALQCPVVLHLPPGPWLPLLRVALRLVPLVCAAAALWVALRHWRSDLVESRRRLRLLLVAAGIGYTLLQLGARLSTPLGLMTPDLALLDIAALLALVGGWALLMLRLPSPALLHPAARELGPQGAQPARGADTEQGPGSQPQESTEPVETFEEAPPGIDAAEERLAEALRQAMHQDRLHRSDDLTLSALAARLEVPEYRLRRHINQRLGFRNFNAFVNSHRLADAQRWLADPTMQDTPILTLALDAGFGSIGPFNRAFKAETGLTPSEFRSQALAQPPTPPQEAAPPLADS